MASSSSSSLSRAIRRLSILSAVGAGALLGTGGWSLLSARHQASSIAHEQQQLRATIKRIDSSVASSESALITLETEQRQLEQDLTAADADLAILHSKVREAERTRQGLLDAGSHLAEKIGAQTHVLQGLLSERQDKEAALVVKATQQEACVARLAKAKEQWWVTRML